MVPSRDVWLPCRGLLSSSLPGERQRIRASPPSAAQTPPGRERASSLSPGTCCSEDRTPDDPAPSALSGQVCRGKLRPREDTSPGRGAGRCGAGMGPHSWTPGRGSFLRGWAAGSLGWKQAEAATPPPPGGGGNCLWTGGTGRVKERGQGLRALVPSVSFLLTGP